MAAALCVAVAGLAAPPVSAVRAAPPPTPDYGTLVTWYARHPGKWPPAVTADGEGPQELAPLLSSATPPAPALAALGRRLFHDPLLSRDRTVSCASCHEERLHFTDARRMAVGIEGRQGRRNTPAIFAIDAWESFFWDGRAGSAQAQVRFPIEDPLEMDTTMGQVLARLNADADYREHFRRVFPVGGSGAAMITEPMLSSAIVAFERTLAPPSGRYADYIALAYRKPQQAIALLSEAQLRGMHLFRTKAKCMTCHEGPLLSDNRFHGTGLHYYGRRYQDLGRYEVTGRSEDAGRFRTPSLLGLSRTGPWMHNGLFSSLRGIINLYDAGGARPKPRPEFVDDPLFPETSDLLHRLELTGEEKTALEAFLRIL